MSLSAPPPPSATDFNLGDLPVVLRVLSGTAGSKHPACSLSQGSLPRTWHHEDVSAPSLFPLLVLISRSLAPPTPAGREERPAEELAWRRICKRRNLLLRMKSGGELNKGRRVIDRLYPIIERAQSVCTRSQMAAGKIQGGCQPVSPGTAESSLKKSNQTLSFGPSRIPGLSLGIYGEQFARLMACQGFWGPLFPCGVAQSGEGGLQDCRASSVPSRDRGVMAPGG